MDPSDRHLYHLAIAEEWAEAIEHGTYRRSTLGRSLEEQGFIHCSFAEQVQLIADVIYRGRDDVVLVEIDPSLVAAEIRVENLDGGAMPFPHVYGPLAVDAVVGWQDVPLGSDGRLLVSGLVDRE